MVNTDLCILVDGPTWRVLFATHVRSDSAPRSREFSMETALPPVCTVTDLARGVTDPDGYSSPAPRTRAALSCFRRSSNVRAFVIRRTTGVGRATDRQPSDEVPQ